MSTKEEARKEDATQVEDDDEPDEWDKRIFSTGCADENAKMTDCYFEKKDWRACTEETAPADAKPVQTPAAEAANGPSAQPAATAASAKRPVPVRRSVPLKKPLPARKPAAPSPQSPAPRRPEPTALDKAERNEAQASRLVPGTSGRPFPSKDLLQEVRAPTSPMKNTYEAKTVTVSHPKEHATANDIDVPWDASFHGISTRPVTAGQFKVLMRPIDEEDIEVKPDGIIYLPEIKYRRRLNEAFGPMGWGMIPKSDPIINGPMVTREYALIVDGRFVSQAQGENHFYNEEGIPSAVEGCKSNALMRCCKDLGIASDLWDPRFIRSFKKEKMEEVWVEHQVTKKKRVLWFKKGQVEVAYPFKRT
ncbi:unnamed protein product [Clonostachys rhizophaga]|uniref:Mitochondrial genome maintenance protein MGM101 n=1 Tax=Clonostachys rhizophaga TaxID=160324 RepID=A0A9N9V230_9HYPO|nr:unnamed protein product [Clonostachys rhizophaga]